MNKVLIYLGTSNLKEKVIEDVFKQIGIEINYIDDDDLENTLEKLLELPRKESKKENENHLCLLMATTWMKLKIWKAF